MLLRWCPYNDCNGGITRWVIMSEQLLLPLLIRIPPSGNGSLCGLIPRRDGFLMCRGIFCDMNMGGL